MGKRDDGEVAALRARVEVLREELEDLRAGLAQEVRSRRVAVVDAEGVERVVLSARFQAGSVLCRLDQPEGYTTGVELVAAEDPEGLGEGVVGVFRMREGGITPCE